MSKNVSCEECIEFVGSKLATGYGQIYDKQRGKVVLAHRYYYECYWGAIPEGKQVMHRCDNPACVNPKHLFLGTQSDNMHDMDNKGRRNRGDVTGERNGHAKLTREKVQEIRSRYSQGGICQHELAKEYGVSQTQIGNIVNNKSWNECFLW